jgi:hypothetical protein
VTNVILGIQYGFFISFRAQFQKLYLAIVMYYLSSSFGFMNSFHTKNMITATTTPAIPAVTTVVVAEPNIHFQNIANNMAPMTRAAI